MRFPKPSNFASPSAKPEVSQDDYENRCSGRLHVEPRRSELGRTQIAGRLRNSLVSGIASDRKSTRLNSSHSQISYAVFCLKKKDDVGDLRLGADVGEAA